MKIWRIFKKFLRIWENKLVKLKGLFWMKESFKIFTIFSGKYFEKLCKNYRENERNSEFIGKKFH